MNAKLEQLNEMSKVLSVKASVNDNLTALFGQFGLGNLLRHLSLEKKSGVSAVTLILALCLIRINGFSIFQSYRKRFFGLLEVGKNCFYRMMLRPSMNWRRFLIGVSCRFQAIVRKKGDTDDSLPKCFIIDDTTLEKTGLVIEGLSRVYDHVCGRCVLGFKLLLLAFSDGKSTIPVDFSLHREKGKDGKFGLSREQLRHQYREKRDKHNPDNERFEECNRSKLDIAIEMLHRAYKYGLKASYVLTDSWFTCERLIAEVRKVGNGTMHFIGLAKMGKTKYKIGKRQYNVYDLIALHEREACQCRKYKCLYISLRVMLGGQRVRIFLIKYGRNKNWNILISSDENLKFIKAFELYQIRWSIEVLNKECKSYLGLGQYQGRNFNGQIADCTLCFTTYIVLSLGKRFSDYETMGELFMANKEELLSLTLWRRILSCIENLLNCLASLFGLSPEELIENILADDKRAKQLDIILRTLQYEMADKQTDAD